MQLVVSLLGSLQYALFKGCDSGSCETGFVPTLENTDPLSPTTDNIIYSNDMTHQTPHCVHCACVRYASRSCTTSCHLSASYFVAWAYTRVASRAGALIIHMCIHMLCVCHSGAPRSLYIPGMCANVYESKCV